MGFVDSAMRPFAKQIMDECLTRAAHNVNLEVRRGPDYIACEQCVLVDLAPRKRLTVLGIAVV